MVRGNLRTRLRTRPAFIISARLENNNAQISTFFNAPRTKAAPARNAPGGGRILYCVHKHQRQADICGQRGRQQRTNDDADHAQHFFPPETHGGQDDPGDRQKEQ